MQSTVIVILLRKLYNQNPGIKFLLSLKSVDGSLFFLRKSLSDLLNLRNCYHNAVSALHLLLEGMPVCLLVALIKDMLNTPSQAVRVGEIRVCGMFLKYYALFANVCNYYQCIIPCLCMPAKFMLMIIGIVMNANLGDTEWCMLNIRH